MLILLHEPTARHRYVFAHIFGRLGVDYSITHNKEEFLDSEQPKFSYGYLPVDNELHFFENGLLSERDLRRQMPDTGSYCGVKVLFNHSFVTAALPYDIFSAVFYMLTRYEEYLPFRADEHGRFEADQSLAQREGFQYIPVVDYWIGQLAAVLGKRFPELKFTEEVYRFVPTYDIDIAYSFRHKGWVRNLGGFMRDSFRMNCDSYFSRLLVLPGLKPDPFDSYDYQFALQEKYGLQPIYFFHPGTYGKYDKNIAPENKNIRKLLGRISEKATLGLHPSWLSADKPEMIPLEKIRLEEACGKPIYCARQHFIRLRFPDTYRNYIAQGITDDYSMGWATDAGFRAGTSREFKFFDLLENKSTELTVHPFVFMEGVFKFYKNYPTADIMAQIEALTNEVKKTKGTFISLWHNESLGTSRPWQGWREIYEQMIELAKP